MHKIGNITIHLQFSSFFVLYDVSKCKIWVGDHVMNA